LKSLREKDSAGQKRDGGLLQSREFNVTPFLLYASKHQERRLVTKALLAARQLSAWRRAM
jgi:hypothetical protein